MRRFDRSDVYCLVMVLVWGINMPLVKDVLHEISPMSFNALRLILASIFLWILTLSLKQYRPFRRQDLLRLVLLGLVGNTAYQVLFIYGLHWTKAGNVALLLSGATIMTALLSRLLGHERLGRIVWVGIGISLGGVVLILVESAEFSFGAGTLKGDLLVLGCAVCWAFYTVVSKPMMETYRPISLTAATLSIGGVFFFLLALPEVWSIRFSEVSLKSYLTLGYSFLFALGLGYALWFNAIDRIGSTRTSIYGNLIPFVGILGAWLLIGERVTWFQLAGGGLILTGIYMTRQGRSPDMPIGIRQRLY